MQNVNQTVNNVTICWLALILDNILMSHVCEIYKRAVDVAGFSQLVVYLVTTLTVLWWRCDVVHRAALHHLTQMPAC